MIPREIQKWVALGCIGVALIFIVLTLSWCSERSRIDGNVASATGKALDKVAAETPVIRQDQEEKKREVDEIQGASDRLPDGFGADLERVRRGRNPRQP